MAGAILVVVVVLYLVWRRPSEYYRPGMVDFTPGDASQAYMVPEVMYYAPDGNLAPALLRHQRMLEMSNEQHRAKLAGAPSGDYQFGGVHVIAGSRVPAGVQNPTRGDVGVHLQSLPSSVIPVGVLHNSDGGAMPVVLPPTNNAIKPHSAPMPVNKPPFPAGMPMPPYSGPGGTPPASATYGSHPTYTGRSNPVGPDGRPPVSSDQDPLSKLLSGLRSIIGTR
jgi:hypothetical protein